MRRQVTIGGLVALALMSGSVVAFAQQAPPPPGECAPVAAASEPAGDAEGEQLDGTQPGLVPSARPATGQDEPEEDEPSEDEPSEEESADDEEPSGEPADGEPADEEPADGGEPADGEEPAQADPADQDPSEEPADAAATGPGDDAPTVGDDTASALDACAAPEATAAAALDWGTPDWAEEFDGPLDETAWQVYTGTGFDGRGTRTPDALTVSDGLLTITGDADGATGGMSAQPGQLYGRWEARVRAPESDESYNPVLLLWPDDETAAGSEIDFMEMLDPTRQTTSAFVHHGAENEQVMGEVAVDGTQWHNWAVEWTPTSITTYVDGVEWWRVEDPAVLPQGPMHLCVQLDWFPTGDAEGQEASMQVDWVRQYALDPESADEPSAEPADEPAAEPMDEPAADEPAADEPAADEPAADEPAADEPAADESAAEPGSDAADEPGDGGDGDGGDGDGDGEGAPTGLSEGAPDVTTARPGLVERATPAIP